MIVPEDAPHIQAQCSSCGFLFDMKFSLDCPACHHMGVRWARLLRSTDCEQHSEHAPHIDDCGTPCSGVGRADKDVIELDKLFALEDPRSKP